MNLTSIYLVILFTVGYAKDPAQAVVVNSCNRSLWYASVDDKSPPAAELLPGSTFRETFRVYPGSPLPGGIPPGGISIKVSEDPSWESDDSPILQFEYTYDPATQEVWYDLSNVNGDPFLRDGFTLQPTSPDCTTITCAPGEETCHDAFTYPTETGVVFRCNSNNSLVLTVCLADSSVSLVAAVSTTYSQSILASLNQDSTRYYSTGTTDCGSASYRDTSTSTATPTDVSQCSKDNPCHGDMTWFQAGPGSCGLTSNGEAENVVALSQLMMGPQSYGNPYCGKTITITCLATGKTATATVVDKCEGCDTYSIDLSIKTFLELDALEVGRTGASWYFN